MVCATPPLPAGGNLSVATRSIGDTVSAVPGLLDRDQPVLSSIDPNNGSIAGGARLQLTGQNFGTLDSSLSVFVGLSTCVSQIWTSDTGLACIVRPGSAAESVATSVAVPGAGRAESGDGWMNNSFTYTETSAPPISTTPPPDMFYAKADCTMGNALSTNEGECSVLLPDGQGVQVPPGAWPVTQPSIVSVTVVNDTSSLFTEKALAGALPVSAVLYLQPTGTRFPLAPVTVRLKYDSNVLKSAGSRILAVQRFSATSGRWEGLLSTVSITVPADSGNGSVTFAQGSTDRFSHYAAFLVEPAEPPVSAPEQPKNESEGSQTQTLWMRLKYEEKILVIVLPVVIFLLSVLLLGVCLCWRGTQAKGDVESFHHDSENRADLISSSGEDEQVRPSLQEIRSMVKQEIQGELQERSLLTNTSMTHSERSDDVQTLSPKPGDISVHIR